MATAGLSDRIGRRPVLSPGFQKGFRRVFGFTVWGFGTGRVLGVLEFGRVLGFRVWESFGV